MPDANERHLLWMKALPEQLKMTGNADLKKIAEMYDLSGANIINLDNKNLKI